MSKMEIKTVTPYNAWKTIQEGESVTLIDVRDESEFQQAHIPGAINIPYEPAENFTTRIRQKAMDPDDIYYVYCHGGRRAAEVVNIMNGLGYTNAYSLGGIKDWPYATETSHAGAI